MKKRAWYLIGIAALLVAGALFLLLSGSKGGGTYDNLIKNGDFERWEDEGTPEDWYTIAYVPQGYSAFGEDEGVDGRGAFIRNLYDNDARFAQSVSVSPNTLYHLHGFIKADADGGRGANLSIEGLHVYSASVYQSEGAWEEVSLYGRTGSKQREVTVYARLGGYGGEAVGSASFDQITLQRVDSVPSEFWEYQWYQENTKAETGAETPGTAALSLVFFSLLYLGLFFLALPLLRKQDVPLAQRTKRGQSRIFFIAGCILVLGALLRILIALTTPGYDVDMGCFKSWSATAVQTGPARFYQHFEESGGHCDYPPGYILILWLIGLFSPGGTVSDLAVKLPSILCDLALCLVFFTEGRKTLSDKAALVLTALYALNPLVLVTGAGWGQADSVLTLMIVLTVLFALRGQWKAALPIYMASVLVKPQALMFGPLGLIAFAYHLWKQWKTPKTRRAALIDSAIGIGSAVAVGLAIVLPFSLQRGGFSWLIELYGKTMQQYNYVTLNTCNLYFLFRRNWISVETNISSETLLLLCTFLLSVLPVLAPQLLQKTSIAEKWRSKEGRLRLILLSSLTGLLLLMLLVLMLAGVLTYALLGSVLIGYAICLTGLLFLLSGDIKNLPLLGAVMLFMLYTTGTMMHERYLFPCIALLWLAYFLKKDKYILYLAVAMTLTGFLNVSCALDRNARIGGFEGHLDAPAYGIASDMAWMEYLAAGLNCLLCGAAIMLGCLTTEKGYVPASLLPAKEEAQRSSISAPHHENHPLPRLKKRDYLLMLGVTFAYALLAFHNLGSTKAPQTPWIAQAPEEQVILDLGSEQAFHLYYYGGIHSNDSPFIVEVSTDGERWSDAYSANMSQGDCFKWMTVSEFPGSEYPADLSARYIRVTAKNFGLTLFEMLPRSIESGETLPVIEIQDILPALDYEIVPYSGDLKSDPMHLIDEPDTLVGNPGWYNSTYFDEIYHARTGYEHLHGMYPYETTHPPLGKVFMSACIAIFGMTPFGWRFAGALAGVLMLPGMYLLGHALIRRKWGGPAAMLLMAFDLMHFTQTRIATIDSFVVLFIIWEVYFMLRWFFLDYFKTPFRKTFIPLVLCGTTMGLAIASKWTGVYAAFALAFLLFFGIARRGMEIRQAKEKVRSAAAMQKKKKGQASPELSLLPEEIIAAKEGTKRLLITLASCFIIFIFLPLLIYYLSYIPYFAPSGGVTVKRVVEAAIGDYFTTGHLGGMLGYHGAPGLGMDHSFYSPWYQWPIIGKPMWYFQTNMEAPGLQSTILSMGNPAIWWLGLLGLLGTIVLFVARHYRQKDHSLQLYTKKDDPRFAILLLCFAVQYLPWVLVPRGTYIYHYFPSVPFIILCGLLCLDQLSEKWEKIGKALCIVWIVLAALLFVAFFPYASGIAAPQEWMDFMKWFPNWLWY